MKLKTLPLLILPAVLAACGHGTEDFKKDDKGTDDKKPAVVESQKFIPAKADPIEVQQGKDFASVKLDPQGEKATDPTKVLFTKTIKVDLLKKNEGTQTFNVYVNSTEDKPADAALKIGEITVTNEVTGSTEITKEDAAKVFEIFKNTPDKVYLVVDGLKEGDKVTFTTEAELKK